MYVLCTHTYAGVSCSAQQVSKLSSYIASGVRSTIDPASCLTRKLETNWHFCTIAELIEGCRPVSCTHKTRRSCLSSLSSLICLHDHLLMSQDLSIALRLRSQIPVDRRRASFSNIEDIHAAIATWSMEDLTYSSHCHFGAERVQRHSA